MSPTSRLPHDLARRDLLDTLHALGRFRTFIRLAVAAELVEDLAGPNAVTLFAPTDDAFAALPGGVEALFDPEHAERLCDRMEYHLVRGRLDLDEAIEVGAARSVHGAEIHFALRDGGLHVDGARLLGLPIPCTNGLLCVIDAPLAPAVVDVEALGLAQTAFAPAAMLPAATSMAARSAMRIEAVRRAPRSEGRTALLRLPSPPPMPARRPHLALRGPAALRSGLDLLPPD
jgi:uncharacterized surface protein with fasciclin (FAS1) repeats